MRKEHLESGEKVTYFAKKNDTHYPRRQNSDYFNSYTLQDQQVYAASGLKPAKIIHSCGQGSHGIIPVPNEGYQFIYLQKLKNKNVYD